ncbi:MAG: hypothetical protein ACOC6H_05030 [Thermoproteota archaeon]
MKENICFNGMCNNRVEGLQLVCDECLEREKERFSEMFERDPEFWDFELSYYMDLDFSEDW